MPPLAVGSLVPAIFGLVGVAVGAILTGAVEWIREARRDRRRARAAARLLRSDLFLVSRILRNAISDRALPGFIDVTPRSWLEQRDLLASELKDDEWIIVSGGCSRLQTLAEFVSRIAKPQDRGRLSNNDIPRLDKALTDLVRAHDALGRLAEDGRPYDAVLELDPPLPRA